MDDVIKKRVQATLEEIRREVWTKYGPHPTQEQWTAHLLGLVAMLMVGQEMQNELEEDRQTYQREQNEKH